MRRPPAGEVWIHVDRLDREDRKVWAVQYRDKDGYHYDVAGSVITSGTTYTQYFGPKGRQPKAVIVVPGGRVTMRGDVAIVQALAEQLTG